MIRGTCYVVVNFYDDYEDGEASEIKAVVTFSSKDRAEKFKREECPSAAIFETVVDAEVDERPRWCVAFTNATGEKAVGANASEGRGAMFARLAQGPNSSEVVVVDNVIARDIPNAVAIASQFLRENLRKTMGLGS